MTLSIMTLNPPSIKTCKEWIDILWYFLKSTDSIVQKKKLSVAFILHKSGIETQYGYCINIEKQKYPYCKINGWFPNNLIDTYKKENYFHVSIRKKEYCSGIEYNTCIKKHKLSNDKFICGKAMLDSNSYRFMMEKILSAY